MQVGFHFPPSSNHAKNCFTFCTSVLIVSGEKPDRFRFDTLATNEQIASYPIWSTVNDASGDCSVKSYFASVTGSRVANRSSTFIEFCIRFALPELRLLPATSVSTFFAYAFVAS